MVLYNLSMIIVGIAKNTDRDLLLDKVAREYFNINNLAYEKLTLSKLSNGKPYIANSNLHVSLSHSGEYLAIALSSNDVGIDIQEHIEVDYLRISKRYNIKADTLLDFYKKYTLAECEVKRTGGILPHYLRIANQLNGIHYENIKGYTLSITPINKYKIIEF